MSKVIDVSSKLGEYMLKGWILTDTICPTPGCNVPLMRSPAARTPETHFCANCNSDSHTPSRAPAAVDASAAPSSPSASSVHYSRSSTPPTEISSGLSSPTFAPPVETVESRRRRQQSDRASAEIGKRLLQGWAMLADECPNPRCYGVPLVRSPTKPGGTKDPKKQCVICERTYIDERDASGWDRLVPVESSGGQTATASPLVGPTSTDSTQRGKAAAQGTVILEEELARQAAQTYRSNPNASAETIVHHRREITLAQAALEGLPNPVPSAAILAPAASLEHALQALSSRLNALTDAPRIMDVSAVGATANAMKSVSDALSSIRELRGDL